MKRFVSYLYSVSNYQKVQNAGFARIELRPGRNRMEIHLRKCGYTGKTGTVYLFAREGENIQGVAIGEILFQDGRADFRYESREDAIGQSPWRIDEMSGLLIRMGEQAAYISQWDEKPLNIRAFGVWEPHASKAAQNPPQPEQSTPEQQPKPQPEQSTPGQQPKPQPEESTPEQQPQPEQSIPEQQPQPEQSIPEQQSRQDAGKISVRTAELAAQREPKLQTMEQRFRYMLRMYPVLEQFGEDALCVRIELKDFRLLPEEYRGVMNNSFLLHGFFNYRYVVFGRMGEQWFLGVPGMFQNQEHVMASLFGFPDFLAPKQKDAPGFWYRTLT